MIKPSKKNYNTVIMVRLPNDIAEYCNKFIINTKLYTCIPELILDSIHFTLRYFKMYEIEIDNNGNEKVVVGSVSGINSFCKFMINDEINKKLYGKKNDLMVSVAIRVPIGQIDYLPRSMAYSVLARYSLIFYLSEIVPDFHYSFFNTEEADSQ